MQQKFEHKSLTILAICFCLTLNIWIAVQNRAAYGVDFNQFYSASRLVGTGQLYKWEALRKLEAENGVEVRTGRLPVVIYGYKLLGYFPYSTARIIWTAGGIAALMIFALAWPGASRSIMTTALACSIPATLAVLFGQDIPLWLMFFAIALLMLERKKPWVAGMVFSLCICKFHLSLGIPVMLVAQKRWKTLIGGGVAFVVLISACFLIEGSSWPLAYKEMVQVTQFSPAYESMPNLRGLTAGLPWPGVSEAILATVLLLLLWLQCRENEDVSITGATAMAAGLTVAHHGLVADSVLLIPLTVLTITKQGTPSWLKAWAIVLLSPLTMWLILAQRSHIWQLLIVGFVATSNVLSLVAQSARRMLMVYQSVSQDGSPPMEAEVASE